MYKNLNAHILVFVATFLVAGSFIVSAKLSGIIDPISLTLYRFVFASIVLAPFIFSISKFRARIVPSFKKAMIISFFYSSFFIGLFKALEYTTALNTGTIFTFVPLLTAILSIFVFKQKISTFQFLIYLLGILGTCVVIFKGDINLLFTLSLNSGDIIFLFAIVFMALYSITAKYFYEKEDEVLVLTFMTLIGGCIWMYGALFLLNIPLNWRKIEGELFFHMVYLSIGATLVTVYLYQKATIALGPKKLMAYIYLNPAVIAILLFIFEGVVIPLEVTFGIVLSTFATVILLFKK